MERRFQGSASGAPAWKAQPDGALNKCGKNMRIAQFVAVQPAACADNAGCLRAGRDATFS